MWQSVGVNILLLLVLLLLLVWTLLAVVVAAAVDRLYCFDVGVCTDGQEEEEVDEEAGVVEEGGYCL